MDIRGWSMSETRCLVSIWADESVQQKLEDSYRNRPIYEAISTKMQEKGYSRSYQQCQRKIKHLKNCFRKAKDVNNKSGRDRASCPFYEELDRVLGDRPSFCPGEGDAVDSELDYTEEPLFDSTSTPPDCTEIRDNGDQADDAASSPSPQASPQPQPQSSSSKRPANFSTGPTRWKKTKFETLEAFARAMSSNDDELQLQMQRAQHAHENRLCDRVMQSIESLASTLSSALRPPAPSTPSHPGQLSWYQPMPPQPSQPAPAGPSLMPHPPVENGGIMPSNGIKEEEQGEITTKTPQSSPATSNPHIRPDVSNEDVGLTSSHSTNLSTSLLSASQGTRDAVDVASNTTSNERYVTEESTAATSDGQLHVIKTEIRVPTGSDSTEHFIRPEAAISTCSDLDTMDLDQLKREKIKMQLKVLKLQDEYYTLKINNLKK
ncbi:myb/SANT-like DNA-binding domain-containing protein 7 isoform X1 [Centropristis striata]|uniref:myb/SANT-like DNA-binding domain-containing protein 7 isoform X1 n=1 Tax=Centropristis striata TaxID=184440 RepID=UPI0027E0FFD8|nr:myb/SANT-like DNA-binding domain-containing protein 7 isoform X1 [Centropristis striata]